MASDSSGQLDPDILKQWYTTYERRLKAFLVGLLRDSHTTEEAFQNTMTKAFTHGGSIETGKEKAWLFQVAFNEAMLIRRKQGTAKKALQKLSRKALREVFPKDELIQQETADRIWKAIEELPADQQDVITMRMQDEKTFQRIAGELEIPLGTVLTRMRLALSQLRTILKHEDKQDFGI